MKQSIVIVAIFWKKVWIQEAWQTNFMKLCKTQHKGCGQPQPENTVNNMLIKSLKSNLILKYFDMNIKVYNARLDHSLSL